MPFSADFLPGAGDFFCLDLEDGAEKRKRRQYFKVKTTDTNHQNQGPEPILGKLRP